MNAETLREYCLAKPGVTEHTPFGPDNLVFKVGDKMFLIISLDEPILSFNAKCDPEKAVQLREQYSSIKPGYHMNKQHWNTVTADGSLRENLVKELVDDSYELIKSGLSKKKQEEINKLS